MHLSLRSLNGQKEPVVPQLKVQSEIIVPMILFSIVHRTVLNPVKQDQLYSLRNKLMV